MSSRQLPRPSSAATGAQLSLFDGATPPAPGQAVPSPDPDASARAYAVDPRYNVVLEASAGTGKTSVLVARYVNLLKAGVDPGNILAITFTRKAAAEMRERIVRELRSAAERSEFDKARWLELRDRLGDIAISTIDAFCLSLLREFPLESDVDPAFDLADETEVPRLIAASLDRTLRILIGQARSDPDISLVLAQLGTARAREGLATLLQRRLVAWEALERFLARGPRGLTAAGVCRAAATALSGTLHGIRGGLPQFLDDGPSAHPRYQLFRRESLSLAALPAAPARADSASAADPSEAALRATLDRISAHFLTAEGKARKSGSAIYPYRSEHYPSKDAAKRHRDALFETAAAVERTMFEFKRDLNVVLARGVRRMFAVALEQYRRALDERSVLDFSDVLERAVVLLRRMDEFSQSRYRLESRYHHVLVDEFQDTSRAQWELVSLLVEAWGEGLGLAANPSIFIVGDRKQSIYRFRDAEVAVLEQAAQYIEGLRPDGRARRSIARSFRAVPELQLLVNDVFSEMSQTGENAGAFTYDARDRFPVDAVGALPPPGPVLGLAVAESAEACAGAVAAEIVRLLQDGTVRDKATGVSRAMRPGDIGILFRSRTSHREFERELVARGVPTYVYKGLGFFDADEIKDLTALVRYLAEPSSDIRAAALLRSRFVRISDPALVILAPQLAAALLQPQMPDAAGQLDPEDRRVLEHVRTQIPLWLERVDRVTPAELVDSIITDTAYAFELTGPRQRQAWENVKKMRGLIRRIQNRGYATVPRVAEHLISLTAGDESNAIVEALDAVNLMTVHAAKGLEFPVVFVVNLAKGASGPPQPVRVVAGGGTGDGEPSVSIGAFISDSDEEERDRERHETRRLLYVALTRARDRLYLATMLKDGAFVAGRGSLGEVLPESLKTFFERVPPAFAEVDTLGWTGISGREYSWRLCRPEATAAEPAPIPAVAHREEDFSALETTGLVARVSATRWARGLEQHVPTTETPRSERLLGTVIHRLFGAAEGLEMASDLEAVARLAARLVRPEELATLDDPGAFAARAAEHWVRARARADVTGALAGVARLYEVPFSLRIEEEGSRQVVRGAVDCLVRKPDGRLLVVELKTGGKRDDHRRQLDLYVRAMRGALTASAGGPVPDVGGVLIYL